MTLGDALRPLQRPRLYEQVVGQIQSWIAENGLEVGDRLPPERELASRLGVSRATVSQALVAMEVVGMVSVRHGDGVVLVEPAGSAKVVNALRRHAQQLPEIIEAREALETKLAALAAGRRTESDLAAMDGALAFMERDIASGGRGVEGDESCVPQSRSRATSLTIATCSCIARAAASASPARMASAIFRWPRSELTGRSG